MCNQWPLLDGHIPASWGVCGDTMDELPTRCLPFQYNYTEAFLEIQGNVNTVYNINYILETTWFEAVYKIEYY